jgi:hypothetical protein
VGESLETWEARHQRKAAEGINLHRPLPIAVEQEQRKQWATPRAGKTTDENPETWAARQAKGDVATMPLTAQVKAWATPIMGDSHLASTPEVAQKRIEEGKVTLSRQNPGKLNPRWVETLMGLPVGWVMPSCASPVTIEPMNCDCLETESFQPPQNEHLELF